MPDLGEYLKAVGGKPWIWGKSDCTTFSADWLILCGRPDPMARWRGAYDSEESCAALLKQSSGLLPLWLLGMGEPDCLEPALGDVGVVQMWGHQGGAIFLGERWAVRSPRGWSAAAFAPDDVLGVWRHG